MAYQSWSVVFGEQPTAAKWNILGSNDAHFYDFLGDSEASTSWTPTWTNLTLGNGTLAAGYKQIGNWVFGRMHLTFGTTTSISGTVSFTPPVNAVGAHARLPVGHARFVDATGNDSFGVVQVNTATNFTFDRLITETGANPVQVVTAGTSVDTTNPFTWTTSDVLAFSLMYEGV